MKKVADTLRELLHSSVPGHEETSKALGRSIAMKDAVLAAEALPSAGRFMARTGVGTALGGVAGAAMDSGDRWRGGRLGGAVGAAAMNAPQVTSRLGIAMADPALAALLQQTPRFVLRSKDENQ
jgi:hypothetical protein